jgi:carbamoyltransferase
MSDKTRKHHYVLGVHQSGLIASATVIKDGQVVAGLPEERLTRIKHDRSFPQNAINFCLNECGITIHDIEIMAIGWNPGENAAQKYRSGFSDWMRYPGEWLSSVPNHILPLLNNNILQTNSNYLDETGNRFNINYIDHHTCHARLSYEVSGFSKAALLVADGWSEQKVTSLYYAENGRINKIKSINFPNSVGCFYAAMTEFLGYKPFNDEWKVMGMAAYGDSNKHPQIDKLVSLKDKGEYELDLSFFDFYNFDRSGFFSEKMETLLGTARKTSDALEQRHYDLAAATQALFGKIMDNLLDYLYEVTSCPNVCLSGGVAMNCLYNGKVTESTGFSRCHISFAPDDSGNSIGAALEASIGIGQKANAENLNSTIGQEFENDYIGKILETYKLRHRKVKDITVEVADMLSKNRVIGWVQGKSEFGQRSLGHRSILASPVDKNMKGRLNKAVKFRESYRPFAPMISCENVLSYFDTNTEQLPVRYMEKALQFRKEVIDGVPAVVHNDGTGRLQTVIPEKEPLLHDLLQRFHKITNCPVLLNTSFNLNGEPIVNSPEDAIKTYFTSGIDSLILGDFIIDK